MWLTRIVMQALQRFPLISGLTKMNRLQKLWKTFEQITTVLPEVTAMIPHEY